MSFFQRLFKPKAKQRGEPDGTPAAASIAPQAVIPPLVPEPEPAPPPPNPPISRDEPPRPAAPAPTVAVPAPTQVPSPASLMQQVAMHQASRWQNVYVFISSTFNDMHAERDYLVKQVFPQLQEWCEKRKLRLVDIDLRWGVTEQDATENKRVVQVCLERIDACRPFFLCFLGQRRGWVPEEDDISAQTYADYPELKKYVGVTSVTEMEILHALVNPMHQGRSVLPGETTEHYERVKYAFFYLRQPEYLKDLPADPPQLRKVYTNEAIEDAEQRAEADRQLQRWREEEIQPTGRPAHPYTAHWDVGESTPEIRLALQCPSTAQPGSPSWQAGYAGWARGWAKAGVHVDETGEISDPAERAKAEAFNARLTQGRLADFTCTGRPLAETIIADLQAAIQERYPEHGEVTSSSPLQQELDQQEQALRAASEGFIARVGDFAALDEYVNGPSDRLFVLTAPGGMGKTSLLARWIDRTTLNQAAGETLHYRFIGASDGSTTVGVLLRSILREIQELTGKFAEEIPADPTKLRAALPKLLEAAGKKGKVVIVLDGLNQLESKLSDLTWLPITLPVNVRLIVSFKRGDQAAEAYYAQLQSDGRAILAEVQPFASLDDRRKLVQVYLSQFLKELDERHVEALIRSEGAGNPLYLKVVLAELRVFGAFANLGDKIRADFGTDPVSAFGGVLKRLENDPAYSPLQPELLVPRLFGWLAHARQGLSVEELSGLLVQERLLLDDAEARQDAEQAVHGLLRQVRPYLARRDGRADFFYESFKLAAVERYVREDEEEGESHPQARLAQAWHASLAGYFKFKADPAGDRSWKEQDLHGLSELPYHLAWARQWDELEQTLMDALYLNARTSACDIWRFIDDYSLLGHDLDHGAGEYRAFIVRHAQTLSRHEGQLAALLYHEGFPSARAQIQLARDNQRYDNPWLCTERQGRQPQMGTDPLSRVLETLSCWEYEPSCAVDFAVDAKIAFHVIRLGVIGVVDIEKACPLDQLVTIRRMRPLALFASADGQCLAVAYENGEADILELAWSSQKLLKQSVAASVHYLLPQFEAPSMVWEGKCLIFQQEDGVVTRYDLSSGERACLYLPEEAGSPLELRAAAVMDHDLILGLSSEAVTQLLLVGEHSTRKIFRSENSEIVAVCPCGALRIAAAFSNHEIRIFGVNHQAEELVRTAINDMPICLAYGGESLILATDKGTFYTLQVEISASPVLIQSNQTSVVQRIARRIAFSEGESLILVSQSTVAVLKITWKDSSVPQPILALFQTSQASYAVQKRQKELFLVELASGKEVLLAEDKSRILSFCIDGLDNLLYVCSDGTGFVLNCVSGSRRLTNAIPTTIAAAAGDPQGGFWMADRLGDIHRVELDGSVQLAWTSNSDRFRVQGLFCTRSALIWQGWCSDRIDTGEGRPDTLLFFESDQSKHIRQVGQRLFGKSEGVIKTLACDSTEDDLIVILVDSASNIHRMETGFISDFVEKREIKKTIGWIRDNIRAAGRRSGSGLYLLSHDGTVYCTNTDTWELKAVLSPSEPFQMMSVGGGLQGPILLADSKSDIFSCRLENG